MHIVLCGTKDEAGKLQIALESLGVTVLLTGLIQPNQIFRYVKHYPLPEGIIFFPEILLDNGWPAVIESVQRPKITIILLTRLEGTHTREEAESLGVKHWFVNLRITERIAFEAALIIAAIKKNPANSDLPLNLPVVLTDLPARAYRNPPVVHKRKKNPDTESVCISGFQYTPNNQCQATILRFLAQQSNWSIPFTAQSVAQELRLTVHQVSAQFRIIKHGLPKNWLQYDSYFGCYTFRPTGLEKRQSDSLESRWERRL